MTGHGDYPGAASFVPDGRATMSTLAEAAQGCRGCDLYERATQAVFGRGPGTASVVLIGEQPGDAEDRQGRPFVGPAGRVLDSALQEAEIPAEAAYVTNAVKHFSWKPDPRGGKRRIHQRPDASQLRACRPWLDAELTRLDPRVIVALGATAGQALFGSSFRVTAARGTIVAWTVPGAGRDVDVVPTIHPSAVLRADDRDAARAGLVADLKVAAALLAGRPPQAAGQS